MHCTFKGLDYKNIPEKYLNNDIPEGRGMVKWQPFATMPEQFSKIDQMITDSAKVPPPTHDNEIKQNIELTLRANIHDTIILRWWQDGLEQQWICDVEFIDSETHMIIISKNKKWLPVPFNHIYEVMPFGNRYVIETEEY